jgi:hypothetical protein
MNNSVPDSLVFRVNDIHLNVFRGELHFVCSVSPNGLGGNVNAQSAQYKRGTPIMSFARDGWSTVSLEEMQQIIDYWENLP